MTKGNLASIDLGSNSCRLRVADSNGTVLYKDLKATKLGEGLFETGKLSDASIERGLKAFEEFADVIKKYEVTACRAVATEACRRAKNGKEFLDLVKQKTGISLEIIDPLEEARLNLKGAISNAKGAKYVVVYDLGGASTEITLAKNGASPEILHTVSIPLGARNASEGYELKEYNEKNALKLKDDIQKYVFDFILSSGFGKYKKESVLVATSSTPLRLCSMVKNDGYYTREKNDGAVIDCKDIDEVIEKVLLMGLKERAESPYIGENRASVFVAAVIIFKTIYQTLGFDKMTVSFKGALDAMIEELTHG